MAECLQPWIPLVTLTHGGKKYLCHGRLSDGDTSRINVHVTNGVEVWGTDVTEETLEELNNVSGSTPDSKEKIREIFERTVPVLTIEGSAANLSFPKDSGNVALSLFKLPISEGKSHIQSLLFDLTDRIRDLEKLQRGGSVSTSSSPVKPSPFCHTLVPDMDSRRKGSGISASRIKKRVPGESLVNPGSKSKKAARGVDFEES
ncbi:hypothetical protein GDO86_014758 [Hymenochirus boettgeri]|uniref:Uncharacterized protein n=1 Tax=Hymenochirus boettgeri TaxID=247094 RepID=A0A8T2JSV9_9PIPI|nr:hypothetical protein GDO86_014758 [Hymenochirus boettgeri]